MKKRVIIGILVLASILTGFIVYFHNQAKIVDIAIEQVGKRMDLDSGTIATLEECIDKEDKIVIRDLLEKKVDSTLIKDSVWYVRSNDIDGLKDYLKDTLTEDELDQLEDLYDKYSDVLDEGTQEELLEAIEDADDIDSLVDICTDSNIIGTEDVTELLENNENLVNAVTK